MKGTAYLNIRSGPSGGSAGWAGYISKKASVKTGLKGMRVRHLPDRLAGPARQGFRAFRRALIAHARGRQQTEIAAHGNRAGRARTHYRGEVSFPSRQVDEADALEEVQDWLSEHFPTMPTVAAAHRDTDKLHIHFWGDARQIDGSKTHISKADFRAMRDDWGARHAELMAQTEKRTRGLDDDQAAERRDRLAEADAEKLDEKRTYNATWARHEADRSSGRMAPMIEARRRELNGELPERPRRIGDRPTGGAVYRRRDRRNARQEQETGFVPMATEEEARELRRQRCQKNADVRDRRHRRASRPTDPQSAPAQVLKWAQEKVAPVLHRAKGRDGLARQLRAANARLTLNDAADGGAIISPRVFGHDAFRGTGVDLAELGTSAAELRAQIGADTLNVEAATPKMPDTSRQAEIASHDFSSQIERDHAEKLRERGRGRAGQQQKKRGRTGRSA